MGKQWVKPPSERLHRAWYKAVPPAALETLSPLHPPAAAWLTPGARLSPHSPRLTLRTQPVRRAAGLARQAQGHVVQAPQDKCLPQAPLRARQHPYGARQPAQGSWAVLNWLNWGHKAASWEAAGGFGVCLLACSLWHTTELSRRRWAPPEPGCGQSSGQRSLGWDATSAPGLSRRVGRRVWLGEPLLLGEGAAPRLYPPPRRLPLAQLGGPGRAGIPATGCPWSWANLSSLPGNGHRVARVRAPLCGVVRRPGFPPDKHKDQPR